MGVGLGGLRKFLNIWPFLVLSERKRSLNLRIYVSCDQCDSFDHSLVILSRLMMEFLMVLFSSDSFAFRNVFTERFISVMKLLVGSQSLFLRFHEAFTFWKKKMSLLYLSCPNDWIKMWLDYESINSATHWMHWDLKKKWNHKLVQLKYNQ